jgi:uncharacterized protein (TIGR01244 family)
LQVAGASNQQTAMRRHIGIGVALILLLGVAAWSAQPVALAQEKQSFPNIKNFLRVSDKICTGGQPTMDDLARLKADGVKAIINLRQASEFNAEEEAAKAKELGLRYIHIPVNREALKPEMADEFLKQMSDPANRPVFVHCTTANRVGAFWMIYRVLKDGWTLADAEEEAKKVGMHTQDLRDFALEYIHAHEKKPDKKAP